LTISGAIQKTLPWSEGRFVFIPAIRSNISPERAGRLTILDFFGNTKIGYLDTSFIVHEDICAFDITMDNLPLVEVVQTGQDLPDEIADERFFKCAIVVE
jgi:hypothetical protein